MLESAGRGNISHVSINFYEVYLKFVSFDS